MGRQQRSPQLAPGAPPRCRTSTSSSSPKAVGNASRLCASSRAAVAAALGVAAAAAAAASLAFGSAGLLPPTLPGALAAVGGCELYALLHAYVYLPVSWVGRDDGNDDDDDEL